MTSRGSARHRRDPSGRPRRRPPCERDECQGDDRESQRAAFRSDEYLRQLRVDHAARQLAETDAPMLEIALGTRFADQAHFARAFRRAMGHSPREHRRQGRAR